MNLSTVFMYLTPLILIAMNIYAGHRYNNTPDNQVFQYKAEDAGKHFKQGREIGLADRQYGLLIFLSTMLIFSGALYNLLLTLTYFLLANASFTSGVRLKDSRKSEISEEMQTEVRNSQIAQLGIGTVMALISYALLIWW